MTPKERLVTVREGEARDVVFAKMHENALRKRWLLMTASTCSA
ncbi:inosine 5'-monophosphate dehydrogenase [Citrobacter youngae]|uniref:Inosine 5'-monophosphate dehydrogenase n=1 Tax=Citrobacter youngae TaxID=133448 RepID=A0A9Q7ZZ26_9ENTR|nr:inosine 5'-monophosphate dehydrogenase [Citrobacter youngae]